MPPSVVEFMLDRAGYDTSAIIGESLLDPACGSGSFLVHAARRLKKVLADAMANNSPLERARTFIEQVQTRLVGRRLSYSPCYLAETNLFIQVLKLTWPCSGNTENTRILNASPFITRTVLKCHRPFSTSDATILRQSLKTTWQR